MGQACCPAVRRPKTYCKERLPTSDKTILSKHPDGLSRTLIFCNAMCDKLSTSNPIKLNLWTATPPNCKSLHNYCPTAVGARSAVVNSPCEACISARRETVPANVSETIHPVVKLSVSRNLVCKTLLTPTKTLAVW